MNRAAVELYALLGSTGKLVVNGNIPASPLLPCLKRGLNHNSGYKLGICKTAIAALGLCEACNVLCCSVDACARRLTKVCGRRHDGGGDGVSR